MSNSKRQIARESERGSMRKRQKECEVRAREAPEDRESKREEERKKERAREEVSK